MYSNSYAYIKLSGHLSNKIKISKGTEQGHPLSPDLFKIFLNDLSKKLDHEDCPELSKILISHLLWADDLILLSLSPETCRKQLDTLGQYCNEWGIEVNELKTQVMVLGANNRTNHLKFNLLRKELKIVDTYCYLGIVVHKSGEFRTAQNTLKTKAIRAFFGLKRNVIRSKLSFKALTTLFDSLIKPIVLYGAPVWTPTSTINKSIIKYSKSSLTNFQKFISKINRTPSEKVHLSFLKWALGVHRKSSNVGVWGETGRYPLIYQSIRLTLNYYKRLLGIHKDTFIYAALKEQKRLKLPWFKNIEPLLKLDELFHLNHVSAYRMQSLNNSKNPVIDEINNNNSNDKCDLLGIKKAIPLPSKKFRTHTIIKTLTQHFISCWNHEKSTSSKLTFYNSCKSKFARESYLDVTKGFSRRYSTTKLRISSHDLEIECGRYNNISRENRICKWCNSSMGLKLLEDENHVLHTCDLYADLRAKLIKNLNNSPQVDTINNTIEPLSKLKLDNKSLQTHFMTLLSPYNSYNTNDITSNTFNWHHKVLSNHKLSINTPQTTNLLHRRSYIVNCICTFILRALEKRNKYVKDMRERSEKLNTIVINFSI